MQQRCMVETESLRPAALTYFTAFVRRLSKAETAAAVVVFLALFVAVFAFKMIRVDQFRGDSAMYFQAADNVAHGKALSSQTQASIVDYLNNQKFQNLTSDDIRENPNAFFGYASSGERSLLLGHAYFIMYPLAEFARIFSSRAVLLFSFVASFVGMLVLAYLVLRRENVPALGAVAFCLLIVAQPAWTDGLLWGQFYPDRLFLFLGLLVMVLCAKTVANNVPAKNRARLILLGASVVCASINERSAIVPGLFMILYALLYWKKPGGDRYFKMALGAALLCYGLFIVKMLIPSDGDYGSFFPTSWHRLVAETHAPAFWPMVELFLLVNIPLLLLAVFEWRAAVIVAFLMLPNIFGNIGGAEKVGWATHYPSFYFTPLVWAGLTGYGAFCRKFKAVNQRAAPLAVIAVFLGFLAMLNPSSYQPFSVGRANVQLSFWPAFLNQARMFFFQSVDRAALAQSVAALQQAIPDGSVVSSVEAGMPHLYRARTIEYFPMDIDHADYAVLSATTIDGKTTFSGTINYNTPQERQQVDDLVLARMKHDGYDLAHPVLLPRLDGLAVVRRIH